MLRLIVIILVGALGWMIWWALGKGAYEEGLAHWLETRHQDGWVADVGDMRTAGFPNRFDTTMRDVRLADPDTGIAWTAPMVQLLSLAYRPNEVIAVVADSHVFSTPFQTIAIAHEDARASFFLGASTDLPLESARLTVQALDLSSTLGWASALGEGRYAIERAAGSEATYRLGATLNELSPTDDLRRMLDPAQILPAMIQNMHLDAHIEFDAAWDRSAIEDARPQPTHIDLNDLSAVWGDVNFRAAGQLAVDENGFPDGELTVRAVEWRILLDMAKNAGWLTDAAAGALQAGLELMSGSRDTLDATLGFSNGSMSLGLIPLGPAPRLVIR